MARVLAVASAGGHWDQLMLLAPALDGHETIYATTDKACAVHHGIQNPVILPDCNLMQPVRALRCAMVSLPQILRERPEVVISTGAAPGFFCVLWGRLTGARALWIDSVANAEKLSLSGRMARRIGAQVLTQWSHLSNNSDIQFAGSVL